MHILNLLLLYLLKIIPPLLGIGEVLFIHELGHFILARLLKVDVECLSFGIGPKLFSLKGKKTEFRFSAIPFGGYCRMQGSIDLTKALKENSETLDITEAGSYFAASPVKRLLIFAAGPLTNFILAAMLFAFAAMIPVEHISDKAYITPVSEYKELFHSDITQTGIRKGDLVLNAGNEQITDFQMLQSYLQKHSGESVPLDVVRDGRIISTQIAPVRTGDSWSYGIAMLQNPVIGRSENPAYKTGDQIAYADGKSIEWTYDLYSIGRKCTEITIIRNGSAITLPLDMTQTLPFAWESDLRRYRDSDRPVSYGFRKAAETGLTTLEALGALITFQFDDARTIITGPMKAASSFSSISALAFRTSSASGVRTVLMLLAFVSISIAVGNLIPVPTFDGGGMLMSAAELIKGKPLRPKTYIILQISGMIIAYSIIAFMYGLDIRDMIAK